MIFLYVMKEGFQSFITQFYFNIKFKVEKYTFYKITKDLYYIIMFLFLGTFLVIIFIFDKIINRNLIKYFIGIIIALLFLPLHLIINPIILLNMIHKYGYRTTIIKIIRMSNYEH